MSGETDPILDALSSACGGIITSYVIVADYIDDDGDHRLWSDVLDDQRCATTLGLLAFGDAVERRRAADSVFNDD